jgi:type I restriction enzyme S subunit
VTVQRQAAFELPVGWTWTCIRDLSLRVTKGSTPTSYDFDYVSKGINFVKVENIQNGGIAKQSIKEFITEETHNFLKRSQLTENDILFSIAGTIGRVGIVHSEDLPANINQAIAVVRCPWQFVNPHYLKMFLESSMTLSMIRKKPRGVGMNNIGLEDVKSIEIPFPPLAEQGRIVAEVEELFTNLDAGVESLKKVKAQLKRYRKAVLRYAFEGKLTEEWRKTHKAQIEPTSVLLERIKEERKKNVKGKNKELQPIDASYLPELPESWVWVRLGDISETTSGGTPSRKHEDYFGGDIPWLKSGELNNSVVNATEESITHQGLTNSSARIITKGTLLIALYGATVGKLGILGIDAAINQAICAIFPYSGISQKFLFWYLIKYRDELLNVRQGGAQPNISQGIINNVVLPLTSLQEQEKIVEEIESKFSVSDETEKVVKQSMKHSERLRQSIFRKAFEGKLVPQDPTDEPAEELLKRIKNERVSCETSVKPRKKDDAIEEGSMRFVE